MPHVSIFFQLLYLVVSFRTIPVSFIVLVLSYFFSLNQFSVVHQYLWYEKSNLLSTFFCSTTLQKCRFCGILLLNKSKVHTIHCINTEWVCVRNIYRGFEAFCKTNGFLVVVDSFCRIIAPSSNDWRNYDVNVTLIDYIDLNRAEFGLTGVIYNVQDVDNFDFVLFAIR